MAEPTEAPTGASAVGERMRELAPSASEGLSRDVGLQLLFRALAMPEAAEVRIGRFVVKEKLGQGGMGTVYRAFDPRLERDVALKVLEGTLSDADADAVRQEARALARLAHPHVVAVYELGIEDHQAFVAMEYVSGPTVRAFADQLEEPDPQRLIELFLQAGRGLVAAHDAGLIHRDIKPENLLVRPDGRVLLADFGLACRAEAPQRREVAGTPLYMAPEVVATGKVTVASDQFAFCASLWTLLDPAAPLRSPTASIPAGVREVLTRGLAIEPEERWASMRDLLTALSACLERGPEAHHRAVLLQRVERLWIRGVLQASLAEGPVLSLPMSSADDQIESPWTQPHPTADLEGGALLGLLEAGQGTLLVLGEPGAGKTTTLLQLADAMLEGARVDASAPVPVVLLLASLASHRGKVELWIEQELVAKYGLPRRNVRRWIEDGAVALLLDGLDEIGVNQRARCVDALNTFRAEFGLSMVVTCRTSDYAHLGRRLAFGRAVCIDPVPTELVANYPGLQGPLDATLRTPLMLGLLGRCEGPLPAEGAQLPWLYERYVEYTFDAASVDGPRRTELLAGLGFLAAAMARNDRSELWLEQLEPTWLFDDRRRIAAQSLGVLGLTTVVVGLNVLVGAVVEGDPASGLIFGVCSVPVILALNGGLRIHPVERLRFSWRRLLRLAPLTIGLGLLMGAVYGLFYILWVNIVFGAFAGVVVVATLAFEPSFQESGVQPNQGIWQSLVNGLVIGGIGLVFGGGLLGYVAVPLVLPYLEAPSTLVGIPHPERSAAAVAGPLLGLIAGMVRGGWAVIMHGAVRLVLAATTAVPLRMVLFLDQAVELALMRRVGGGYLFLHRTFQAFLSERAGSS